MVLSVNRKLGDLAGLLDSAQSGTYLTLNDSAEAIFRSVLWTEIANRPNVLDSADISALVTTGTNALIDAAPAALDTLNEIAAAINDDATFSTTVTNLINALPDSAQVATIVTDTVTQAFVNALNINASTLDNQSASYYLDYNNFTNTPAIGDSAAVATVIDKAYVDALNVDADTLDNQDGTYYLDYTNFTNTPNVLDSANVTSLVDAGITSLVDAAPGSLDTLNEIAAALNDDANFAATVTAQIAAAVDSAEVSGLISSNVDKTFVDALNVNADTLDGQQGTYYLDYTNFTNTPNVLDSADVVAIADSARITGIVDSGYINLIVDSSYVNNRVTVNSGFETYSYITSAAQTSIADSDENGSVLTYQAEGLLVFYNGVLLINGIDYTATDGSSVTLTTAADSGDNVIISKWAIPTSGGSSSFFLASAERALYSGGYGGYNIRNIIDYVTISTTGNATDFGDTSAGGRSGHASVSDNTYGLFAGGQYYSGSIINGINYVTIATTGNGASFGSLTSNSVSLAGASDATYGVFAGGSSTALYQIADLLNIINYVTIATTGNAQDFGDLTTTRFGMGGLGDGTYGVFTGGQNSDWSGSMTNQIEYVTIASPGNATDFGDILGSYTGTAGLCDGTYGIIGGVPNGNTIQYITVATPGNAVDFGDLTVNTSGLAGAGNGTRGVFAGGRDWTTNTGDSQYNIIQYITPSSPGNATDFGDLTFKRVGLAGCAGT